MARNDIFGRLAQQIGERLQDASQAPNEVQRSIQGAMRSAFDRLDLVSREDFDVMMEVLQRTRTRVEALEKQVSALEKTLSEREGGARPTSDDDVAPLGVADDELGEDDIAPDAASAAQANAKDSVRKAQRSDQARSSATTTHNAESRLNEEDAGDLSAKASGAPKGSAEDNKSKTTKKS